MSRLQQRLPRFKHFWIRPPKDIQMLSQGWDMRRRLEVDFAGDDGNFAGEGIAVIRCALSTIDQEPPKIRRYVRCKAKANNGRSRHVGQGPGSADSSPARVPPIGEWRTTALTFGSAMHSFGIQPPSWIVRTWQPLRCLKIPRRCCN